MRLKNLLRKSGELVIPRGVSALVSRPVLVGVLALALLGLEIVSEAASALRRYFTVSFDLDAYQFLEAARSISESGLGLVSYFPHSTVAIDVIYLTHHFPPYLHAVWVKLFDFQVNQFPIILYGELLLALAVTGFAITRIVRLALPSPKAYLILLTISIAAYEPLAHIFFFGGKAYLRWSFIFGTLAVIFLLLLVTSRNGKRRHLLSFLTGLFAGMSPIAFLSLGIPIAGGVFVAFFIENIARLRAGSTTNLISTSAPFLAGLLAPIVAFGTYALIELDTEGVLGTYRTIGFYGQSLVADGNLARSVLKIGYFFSTIIVSPFGPSLLPLGILATAINAYQWKTLSSQQKVLVRVTLVLTATWLFLALLASTHFYAARMIWALPLYLGQIAILIHHRKTNPTYYYLFIVSSVIIVVIQFLHHSLIADYSNYYYGASAFLAAAVALASAILLKPILSNHGRVLATLHRHHTKIVLLTLAIVGAPVLLGFSRSLPQDARTIYGRATSSTESPVDEFMRNSQVVTRAEINPGETVLSNWPLKELFPDDVNRQAIFFYRGLYSGATTAPADSVFLFGSDRQTDIDGYRNIRVGKVIYYRGFFYSIERQVGLAPGYFAFVGSPTPRVVELDAIYPDSYVPEEEITTYLNWRKSKGLMVK